MSKSLVKPISPPPPYLKVPMVMHCPNAKDISSSLAIMMSHCAESLKTLAHTDCAKWSKTERIPREILLTSHLGPSLRLISDPLAEIYKEYHGSKEIDVNSVAGNNHTFDEYILIKEFSEKIDKAVNNDDFSYFLSSLEFISSKILKRNSYVRDDSVFLSPDRHGRFVEYLDSKYIVCQLYILFQILVKTSDYVISRATAAYVLLVGAHPFVDGNGRVARMLFNAILIQSGLSTSSYIPVKELFNMSSGVISIQTRRAIFRGDWSGILTSACLMIKITTLVNAGSLNKILPDQI